MNNYSKTRTEIAKGFIGKTVRFTKPRAFINGTSEGKVVSVQGLNAHSAKVTFENGSHTYYTWDTETEVL